MAQDTASNGETVRPEGMKPRAYLAQFYEGKVDPGNQALLRFYATIYKDIAGKTLLEFGGGPTIYSIITAARSARWIHFCDSTSACLDEVKKWATEDPTAFDWSHFTRYALWCENGQKGNIGEIREEDIQKRHQLIRQRLSLFSRCDAFADDPLLGSFQGPYGVVANTFCLDSITSDKQTWFQLNQKLAAFVADDGLFVTVSLLNASYWTIHGATFPAVTLTLADIHSMYAALGFELTYSDVVALDGKHGYEGFILACGKRSTTPHFS